jgi:hypothetical protein
VLLKVSQGQPPRATLANQLPAVTLVNPPAIAVGMQYEDEDEDEDDHQVRKPRPQGMSRMNTESEQHRYERELLGRRIVPGAARSRYADERLLDAQRRFRKP